MRQDVGRRRPVGRALSNVRPRHAPGRINDKDGGGGEPIAKQIVHAVRIGYGVIHIRQDGIARIDQLRDCERERRVYIGDGPQLGLARAKFGVSGLQLDELLTARASGLAAEKDEHDGRAAHVAQPKRLAVFTLERKIGREGRGGCCSRPRHRRGRGPG
jgi:hypothetical protein